MRENKWKYPRFAPHIKEQVASDKFISEDTKVKHADTTTIYKDNKNEKYLQK